MAWLVLPGLVDGLAGSAWSGGSYDWFFLAWRMVRLVLPGLVDGLAGSTWSGGWSGWYLVLSALLHQSVKKIPPSMKQIGIKIHSNLVWLMYIYVRNIYNMYFVYKTYLSSIRS